MSELSVSERKQTVATPKELIFRYLPFVPWVLLSLVLSLAVSWVKLRYSTPIYNVTGKILVKNVDSYGNDAEKFGNIFGFQTNDVNLNNEVEIIKSQSIAERVVKKLSLQKKISIKGKILTTEAHITDIPFIWQISKVVDSMQSESLLISVISENEFRIDDKPTVFQFGQTVKTNNLEFQLVSYRTVFKKGEDIQYALSWIPKEQVAASLKDNLVVNKQDGASVLTISANSQNIRIGKDIVNNYMIEYQQAGLEDKRQTAFSTLNFIDDQLDTVKMELGRVEKNLLTFRNTNRMFNPELQATQSFDEYSGLREKMTEQAVKYKVVLQLKKYVNDPINIDKLVPSNLGIDEPSLVEQISSFNRLQLEKEASLRTTTSENPKIKKLEVALEKLRQDIVQNLQNVENAHKVAIDDLENSSRLIESNIKTIPTKEKQLLEVTRQQAILQELYSFLLQKKLETAIASASTISDIKVLEPAASSGRAILPDRRSTYITAVLLGLAIPVGIIFLAYYLNDKIQNRQDIEKITQAPVIGEIGHADFDNTLIVSANSRHYISEQFRVIRSNLQFLLPKSDTQIILVTSSFSGEGKSFVSTNIGSVMALAGKKTIMLEFDIRKPKMMKGLGLQERLGLTNYIVGDIPVSKVIYPVNAVENLFVIPCGPVPPNPAELLLEQKIGDLFETLQKQFDVIIIDSAPVGLVSDAITLGAYANTTIYIVRHDYTLKRQIQMVEDIYREKKLPRIGVVINDVDLKNNYGSYYGYGYGYGYGYSFSKPSNDYFEYFNSDTPRRKFFNFFKRTKKKS